MIIGRVYSYDYSVKLLILSMYLPFYIHIDQLFYDLLCVVIETVHNPGTPEETYADSVMVNARNIKHVEILESSDESGETFC